SFTPSRSANMTSENAPGVALQHRTMEILNYFGNCPNCGYTAQATLRITTFADSSTTAEPIGFCGLPCGWTAPVTITTMTDSADRLHTIRPGFSPQRNRSGG
ncbi:hypothetical protein, partial [Nocardia jiangxiensis]|uniref:hypothetical protein n=1 Tax=Nocardia jiangxiensis TaxID=282685 RepID=UPI001C3F45E0